MWLHAWRMRPVKRSSAGLPKSARIRKRREYQRTQKGGQRLRLRHSVFVLLARDFGPSARLGITASRRVGGAVVRNRAKRLIREAFRANLDLFPSDIDLVVIVLEAPEKQRLSEVIDEWRSTGKSLETRIERARQERDTARLENRASPEAPRRC